MVSHTGLTGILERVEVCDLAGALARLENILTWSNGNYNLVDVLRLQGEAQAWIVKLQAGGSLPAARAWLAKVAHEQEVRISEHGGGAW